LQRDVGVSRAKEYSFPARYEIHPNEGKTLYEIARIVKR
jgi:hypothetical protein